MIRYMHNIIDSSRAQIDRNSQTSINIRDIHMSRLIVSCGLSCFIQQIRIRADAPNTLLAALCRSAGAGIFRNVTNVNTMLKHFLHL